MIAFAKNDTHARCIFQSIDRQQPLDENFEQLDKTPKFLHRNDQRFVFLSEMRFHELCCLPIHQFALGPVGAAFRFRRFRSDLLKLRF